MKFNMLKKFNSFINMSIITAVLFLLLGGVIVIFPSTSLKIISYFLALILIIIGISLILKSTSSFVFSDFITSGILSLLLGIILLIYPKMLNIIIPIITGVWFIVSSIFGGTGASGFPLLLKNLRHIDPNLHIPSAQAIMDSKIGAISVLPYFGLTPGKKTDPDSDTFMAKTKSALAY